MNLPEFLAALTALRFLPEALHAQASHAAPGMTDGERGALLLKLREADGRIGTLAEEREKRFAAELADLDALFARGLREVRAEGEQRASASDDGAIRAIEQQFSS